MAGQGQALFQAECMLQLLNSVQSQPCRLEAPRHSAEEALQTSSIAGQLVHAGTSCFECTFNSHTMRTSQEERARRGLHFN